MSNRFQTRHDKLRSVRHNIESVDIFAQILKLYNCHNCHDILNVVFWDNKASDFEVKYLQSLIHSIIFCPSSILAPIRYYDPPPPDKVKGLT